MVVVNPDQVPRPRGLHYGVTKPPVTFHIGRPVSWVKPHLGRKEVEQRPDRLIRIALVELCVDVEWQVVVSCRAFVQQSLPLQRIDRLRFAGPPDPRPTLLLQQRTQSGREPPGTGL